MTNETIADIIAEMRGIRVREFQDYANRLEAAQKRERGDAAKLRDALVKCRDIALQWQADEAAGVAGTTDKPHARSAAEAVIDMEFEINAALATPPRNCDRFGGDIDKLREACARERGLNPEEDFPDVFPGWLLAATEKEGGDNANE